VKKLYSFCLTLMILTWSAIAASAAVTVEQLGAGPNQVILLVHGEFALEDDPASLVAAANTSGAKIVTFDSNGGNVSVAMKFGRAIRAAGLETVQLRAKQCASACALAFVGGSKRTAEPGSIGVHQASFSTDAGVDSSSAVAAVQAVTANIMTYLIEMGVDPRLLQLSLATGSNDMRYLTSSEMAEYRVTGGGASATTAPFESAAAAPSSPETPQASRVVTPGLGDLPTRALDFMERYHEAWSMGNASALAFMARGYAATVNYYGKPYSREQVIEEKRTFAKRWPQRAYSVKPGSARVACQAICTVTAIVEWFAQSSTRNKTSSGVAEFGFIWDPASGQITAETSKVLQTDRAMKEPQRIISQWMQQNGDCRGGRGDADNTWRACDRREAIGTKLEAVGWCYGRENEAGYQMQWHLCGR
jgi:hypothetical protein